MNIFQWLLGKKFGEAETLLPKRQNKLTECHMTDTLEFKITDKNRSQMFPS